MCSLLLNVASLYQDPMDVNKLDNELAAKTGRLTLPLPGVVF